MHCVLTTSHNGTMMLTNVIRMKLIMLSASSKINRYYLLQQPLGDLYIEIKLCLNWDRFEMEVGVEHLLSKKWTKRCEIIIQLCVDWMTSIVSKVLNLLNELIIVY